MFWRAKATIDADEEHWQLETWRWLLDHFGGVEGLWRWEQVYPRGADFPASGRDGHERARAVFAQVAQKIDVETGAFRLVAQDPSVDPRLGPLAHVADAPQDPAGTWSAERNHNIVIYDPALLDDGEALIATFIHEICHALMFSVPFAPPGDAELEEPATDLATVFHGFGVFGGNTAFRFRQYRDDATSSQGWSMQRMGYMTQNEWGYALALRATLAGEPIAPLRPYATPALWTHVERNARYLAKRPEVVADLLNPERA